jgi:hypothetical protein
MPIHYKHLALTNEQIDFFVQNPKMADYFEKCLASMETISHEDFLKCSIYSIIATGKKREEKEIKYLGHDMQRPTILDAIIGYLVYCLESKNVSVQEFVEKSKFNVNLLRGAVGMRYLKED